MTRWQKCDDSICPQHQRHIRISTRAINQLSRVTCLHVWQYLQLSPCARAGAHILVTWTLLFDILVSLEKGNYLYLLMLGCCRAATGVKKRNFMLFTRSCKVAPDARFQMVLCLQILSSSKRFIANTVVKNPFSSEKCVLLIFVVKLFLWELQVGMVVWQASGRLADVNVITSSMVCTIRVMESPGHTARCRLLTAAIRHRAADIIWILGYLAAIMNGGSKCPLWWQAHGDNLHRVPWHLLVTTSRKTFVNFVCHFTTLQE